LWVFLLGVHVDWRQATVCGSLENLFKAFAANPQLFVLQTEFGKKNPNLSVYEKQMRQAIARVDICSH